MKRMTSMPGAFDRAAEDLGNIVQFGHVNVAVPDHQLATAFYITGLGLTRDPFMMTGCDNMWVNVGQEQLHLPLGRAQVLRGCIELVVPDTGRLRTRLEALAGFLAGTQFGMREREDGIEVRCPWGNRFCCRAAQAGRPGYLGLGIVALHIDVGDRVDLRGIVRFYRHILGARSGLGRDRDGPFAWAGLGTSARLVFRGTRKVTDHYDGHHIQITLANFSGPYRKLLERGLISEESDQHQYRFRDLLDPQTREPLFILEHEVRSMRHPMYGRTLLNRNPSQVNDVYVPGRDSLGSTLPIP